MKQSARHRLLVYVLAVIAVLVLLIGYLMPVGSGPSWEAQRERQRNIVRERVKAAGGWEVLQQECLGLLRSDQNHFSWSVHFASGSLSASNLPPAITSLKPHEIQSYPSRDGVPIVRIKLFGAKSTGGRGVPYYGLWIVGKPMPDDYTPELDRVGSASTHKIVKITNSVFEVYQFRP